MYSLECNRAKLLDGIKPHQEDKHGLAGTTHNFLIIQNTNIQLTAWKDPWLELKWWNKSRRFGGTWQLQRRGRGSTELGALPHCLKVKQQTGWRRRRRGCPNKRGCLGKRSCDAKHLKPFRLPLGTSTGSQASCPSWLSAAESRLSRGDLL